MLTLAIFDTISDREPLLDMAVIERYRQRRASLVTLLVDAYLVDAPRYFQQLRQAVAVGDLTAAGAAAHGLKSCSINLGAARLARMCEETEAVAARGASAVMPDVLDRLGPVLFATEDALKAVRLHAAA